jgi:hypothetical protein
MKKLITILIGCCLALAAGVNAAEQPNPNSKQKSKTTQRQKFNPQQRTVVPNTHTPGPRPQQHTPNLNNTRMQNNSSRHLRTLPSVRSNNPVVQPNQLQSNQLQSNKLQSNQLQSNKLQTNKLKFQHHNFHAKPNSVIASVHFNQNFQIKGSHNWKNPHLQVFQSYHPQWHDQGWWHSHHRHLSLIGGGWYYWNAGYWYPAWGYDTNAAYYPYDGPIYVGNNPTPFDQIVADVQSALQEQGLYQGEVDGLVGPQTQEALIAYQRAQGLDETGAIDQPTLSSLGLA